MVKKFAKKVYIKNTRDIYVMKWTTTKKVKYIKSKNFFLVTRINLGIK